MDISVIICSHNPRPHYLLRAVEALKAQTLPKDQWELLLVDNASKEQLAEVCDLTWHPLARHIREDQLGLTPARLRGIKDSLGDLLIFVDDDNLLAPNYLAESMVIGSRRPHLGAWGGSVIGEFEADPPDWVKPCLYALAIREVHEDLWSNEVPNGAVPCGAGMCVRKYIANRYAENISNDKQRHSLGRKGEILTAFEDTDIAYTACDSGLGTGLFKALKLKHLIPASRLEMDYLKRLLFGLNYSGTILSFARCKITQLHALRLYLQWLKAWTLPDKTRQLRQAEILGILAAYKSIKER